MWGATSPTFDESASSAGYGYGWLRAGSDTQRIERPAMTNSKQGRGAGTSQAAGRRRAAESVRKGQQRQAEAKKHGAARIRSGQQRQAAVKQAAVKKAARARGAKPS
jgi:hypothetical protein